MKLKNSFFLLTITLLFALASCQKDNDATPPEDTTGLSTHSDDQSRVSAELDASARDANTALESSVVFSGRQMDVQGVICDATIDVDVVSNPMTITITFDGSSCLGNRTRTGSIVLSMNQGVQWKDAGASITIDYQNYKVTRTSDNKSITFNGEVTLTNVTGGLLANLSGAGTITHSLTANNLQLTFDNGTTRTWNVARNREFTYDNGIKVSITGTHTEGNETNVAEWGVNRFGNSFTTSTVEPMIVRQDCQFRLTSGTLRHVVPNGSATAVFGLDASGNPVSCPAGSFYFKLTLTGAGGNSHSVILPY